MLRNLITKTRHLTVRLYSTKDYELLVSHENCFVAHFPNFLSQSASSNLFEHLNSNVSWQIEEDSFGPQSRLTYYAGDKDAVFCYVGLTLEPKPWPANVYPVKLKLEREILPIVKEHLGLSVPSDHNDNLSGCLMNNYGENVGYIPWHSDEVRAHGLLKCVLSLSLGGPRWFQLRRKSNESPTDVFKVHLQPGSILVMAGETQDYFEHSLPLVPDESVPLSQQAAPHRISLTFRTIEPGFEKESTK